MHSAAGRCGRLEHAPRVGVVGSMVLDEKRFRMAELGAKPVWYRSYGHGGIGRNVCENLGRLGVETAFVGLTEENEIARGFEDRLTAHGVRLFVQPIDGGIGRFDAEIDESGDLGAFTIQLPASGAFQWPVVATATDWLADAGIVVVETGLPKPMLRELRDWTRRHGVALWGLPTRMRDFGPRWGTLRTLDMLVLNKAEAIELLGWSGRESADLARVARALVARGVGTAIVTSGAAGVVVAEHGGAWDYHPVARVETVDTTGAGDAFVAGLAAGLAQGMAMPEAIRLGIDVSSVTVRCPWSTCRAVSAFQLTRAAPSETEVGR